MRHIIASILVVLSSAAIVRAELIYGIAAQGSSQFLVNFDSASPTNLQSSLFMQNTNTLARPDSIVGIDVRPATNELYGLGASGTVYRVNTANGDFTAIGSGVGDLNGFSFGFDFNPTIDRIRVVSDVNKNLVVNPITGSLQLAATDLFYGPADPNFGADPNVGGSAYSNNFVGAATSQLYGIDTGLDILVTQANNTGTLGTVGPLGVNVTSLGGFDISGTSGTAFAAFTPASSAQSALYTINLATGAATNLGPIGGGLVITALAVAPIPEPSTIALAFGAIGLACVRRFRA